MEINLLGPLIVHVDGNEVDITSLRAKGLLVVLVIAPNQKMRHDEIVDRLWPGERVDLDRVRDVRRDLNDRLPQVDPRNENLQCRITLDAGAVDYLRFTRAVTDAKRLEGRERVKKLQEALAEWRGDPLLDPDLKKFDLSRERAFLRDRRRSATLDLLEAMFECGELTGFRAAIRDAVDGWPHDEHVMTVAVDMLAEWGSPSLAASFVSKHIEEHGDPHGRLTFIQARFEPPAAGAPPRAVVPRQLPGRHRNLVGREAEQQVLTEVLADVGPGIARIVLVSGMAGVGKTGLVCAWAAQHEDSFPDGTLYVDLNGFGVLRPEEPEQILSRMLKDLEVEPATTTLDGLMTSFRSATANRSVLVVLDNARDSAQARPLLPGTGCPVVVTSRIRLESLISREGAHLLTVRPLGQPDAVAMLASSLGAARMQQAGHLVDEIAELVGGLPLALAVVAARVASRPAEAVRAIRDALRETKTRLDILSFPQDTDLDVRVALSYSHDGLSEVAADLWALLAVHPGPTISLTAVADLAGRDCTREVTDLVAAHLLEEPAYNRYAMHDLVRDYGIELADGLSPDRVEEATVTAFEFLLQHVWACDRVLVPGRKLPIPAHVSGSTSVPRTMGDAMAWLDDEYPTITAALRKAAEVGADRHTWLLAMALLTYQWRRSKFADADHYLRAAADAAERVASLPDQAMVYRMLAGSRWNMKAYALAQGAQLRAVALSEQAGDRRGVAYGYVGLAALHLDQHEYAQACTGYGEARALFRQLGDELGEADALSGLARVALAEGDHERAVRACADARERYEQTGDVNGQAAVLTVLGDVHDDRGDLSLAAATYDLAVSHYRSLTRHSHEARTLEKLAGVLRLDGRATESGQALRSARQLYRDLGDDVGLKRVEERLATS